MTWLILNRMIIRCVYDSCNSSGNRDGSLKMLLLFYDDYDIIYDIIKLSPQDRGSAVACEYNGSG